MLPKITSFSNKVHHFELQYPPKMTNLKLSLRLRKLNNMFEAILWRDKNADGHGSICDHRREAHNKGSSHKGATNCYG
ncbi:hypothetical protein TNIN_376071 [Trichonephila inaurata madagascariensis]|uniref:Uncharacterized protein n=1 Tax=Trichonephila inaurata madagascariensis TaxID=2747483 RepID=A0A8X7C1M9_9ARAC|nr:hypothetical protein TNIN_376071 [Trichonephila inaurata madagascariensis]